MGSSAHDLLDLDNLDRTERLQSKVSQLKHFAVEIEREAQDHNRLLDDTSHGFESVFGMMSNGRNRLNRLLRSNRGNRKLLCYFAIGLTVFLLFGYALITRALFRQAT